MIDDTIKELENNYDVTLQSQVPLLGGMNMYIVSLVSKPLYSIMQYRMYTNEQMRAMEKKDGNRG